MRDEKAVNEKRRTRAQFGEMLIWLERGWEPAAAGRTCPWCGGPVWLKVFGREERHVCTHCEWGRSYQV